MRKTAADLTRDEQIAVAEYKSVLFTEVYDQQDAATRGMIDKIVAQLRVYNKTPMAEPYLTFNLQWLAVEIVKDMAMVGIRLGTFAFPEGVCAVCGAEAQ